MLTCRELCEKYGLSESKFTRFRKVGLIKPDGKKQYAPGESRHRVVPWVYDESRIEEIKSIMEKRPKQITDKCNHNCKDCEYDYCIDDDITEEEMERISKQIRAKYKWDEGNYVRV